MSFCNSCFDSCQRTYSKRWKLIWLEKLCGVPICRFLSGDLCIHTLCNYLLPIQALHG